MNGAGGLFLSPRAPRITVERTTVRERERRVGGRQAGEADHARLTSFVIVSPAWRGRCDGSFCQLGGVAAQSTSWQTARIPVSSAARWVSTTMTRREAGRLVQTVPAPPSQP